MRLASVFALLFVVAVVASDETIRQKQERFTDKSTDIDNAEAALKESKLNLVRVKEAKRQNYYQKRRDQEARQKRLKEIEENERRLKREEAENLAREGEYSQYIDQAKRAEDALKKELADKIAAAEARRIELQDKLSKVLDEENKVKSDEDSIVAKEKQIDAEFAPEQAKFDAKEAILRAAEDAQLKKVRDDRQAEEARIRFEEDKRLAYERDQRLKRFQERLAKLKKERLAYYESLLDVDRNREVELSRQQSLFEKDIAGIDIAEKEWNSRAQIEINNQDAKIKKYNDLLAQKMAELKKIRDDEASLEDEEKQLNALYQHKKQLLRKYNVDNKKIRKFDDETKDYNKKKFNVKNDGKFNKYIRKDE